MSATITVGELWVIPCHDDEGRAYEMRGDDRGVSMFCLGCDGRVWKLARRRFARIGKVAATAWATHAARVHVCPVNPEKVAGPYPRGWKS